MQYIANALAVFFFFCMPGVSKNIFAWAVRLVSFKTGWRGQSRHCAQRRSFFSHKCPYRNTSIYILGKNISVFVFLTVVHAATLSTLAPTTDQQQPQATLKTNSSSV